MTSTLSLSTTEPQISELRQAVESWRRSRKSPTAMPKELWSAAALLAVEIGVGPVVKSLKVDHGKLMRLAEQLRSSGRLARAPRQRKVTPALTTFVEIPTTAVAKSFSASLSCMLETESPERGRLRAQLDNITALDVAMILREFARYVD